MDTETGRRHCRRMERLKAGRSRTMNNSKWRKVFDLIARETGQTTVQAKMLGDEYMYAMELEIYSEEWRGYSSDWIAGPLKLSEIEYIRIDLPPEICVQQLARAIHILGQYEFKIQNHCLTIYGYL